MISGAVVWCLAVPLVVLNAAAGQMMAPAAQIHLCAHDVRWKCHISEAGRRKVRKASTAVQHAWGAHCIVRCRVQDCLPAPFSTSAMLQRCSKLASEPAAEA